MEPWDRYFDEFRQRAERIPPRGFGRAELLYEAAHDAYQVTTDRITADGGDDEHALVVMRLLTQVSKDWITADGEDWERLRARLRERYEAWTATRREE